ncbi:hydroxyectoine utilization dehydratase EutB [Geminicoccaceae bacterium 1502E]|nr:hydroxyectoine utilization dehydratase EutB [Geminicoccaceae bacterium 1502E]
MMQAGLDLRAIFQARRRIAGEVVRTPLAASPGLSAAAGGEVRLKLELLQESGAFKLRGATSMIRSLDEAERAGGVVTVSTGNHGRAVALAARRAGIRAVVCLSHLVPGNKLEAIRALGAELRIIGRSQDEAAVEAGRLAREDGMVLVPPFDHPAIIAGQGTIGLELAEDWPELDTVLVPLSGGGLIAGIALALKTIDPAVRVIGISMREGAAMQASLGAGRPLEVEEKASLADSLGGGIGLDNRWTFDLCRRLVDEVILLDEEEIAAGMRHLFREERLVVEGAAAVGVGAILAGKVDLAGRCAALVVSGRNVDMERFLDVVGGRP